PGPLVVRAFSWCPLRVLAGFVDRLARCCSPGPLRKEDHVTAPDVRPVVRPVRPVADDGRATEQNTLRPAAPPASVPRLIVVGGVPGAGKTTLLEHVARDVPRSVVLDPDRDRRRFARRLPAWVPYGTYRWAVHALHAVRTLGRLLRGPRGAVPL